MFRLRLGVEQRCLRKSSCAKSVGADGERPTEVVYLGALDARDSEDGALELSAEALPVLQAVAAVPSVRTWLVTRGAQDVRGVEDVIAPDQAAIWGLGRTFALEYPARWGGLIDLDPSDDGPKAVKAIVDAVRADDGEDQMAWRDGMRRIARLVPTPSPDIRTLSLGQNLSYLITGGLGGIGLGMASWLASRGARHLVLVGRTPMPPRPEWAAHSADRRVAAIVDLERTGATVETVAVDVEDPAAMTELMARFGSEWPPLGGIVHAAVTSTVASLADMPHDLLAAMFRTKVRGARLLESLSASQPVEFFVNFSSITAILGSANLAHYAAASAVLDALACRRRAEGKPALTVNWGAWDKLINISEEERAHVVRNGLRPIATATGLAALESLLAAGATRAIVADVDWAVLRAVYETRRAQPLLTQVVTAPLVPEIAKSNGADAPRQIDLMSIDPLERREAIEMAVRSEVAQVIGLRTPDKVDPALDLFKMGMDSLMAIELRRRLERCRGHHPPVGAGVQLSDGQRPDYFSR